MLIAQQRAPRRRSEAVADAGHREATFEGMELLTEEGLRGPGDASAGFEQPGRTSAHAYMRTTMHCMAHTRRIRMLRGVMGLTDPDGRPLQHWA